MALTDQQILSEIQAHLVEPENNGASYASGLWTQQEVIDLLVARERRFLHDTEVILSTTTVPGVPNMHRVALPQSVSRVSDLTFERAGSTFHPLERSQIFAHDRVLPLWEQTQDDYPYVYDVASTPTLQVAVAPAPRDAGIFHLTFVEIAAAITGSGATFTVPDEFLPGIKWGVVSDMLSKVGQAQDPARAEYAEQRYQEWVAAAQIWMAGLYAR